MCVFIGCSLILQIYEYHMCISTVTVSICKEYCILKESNLNLSRNVDVPMYVCIHDICQSLSGSHAIMYLLYCSHCSQAIRDSEHSDRIKKADVEQATSFLHDSGIILHFKDSNLLNDLYFINPQWLCSMLAKLITVREYNPYQRQGWWYIIVQ